MCSSVLVSIVVPIYKVPEKLLHQCIKSLVQQTLTEIEIILVDDGSPDACGQICDEYALRDSRIKVIHKKNGGLAAARNSGQDFATGEALMFLDGDDYLEQDCCELTYKAFVEHNVDLVMFDQYDNFPKSQVAHYSFNDGNGSRKFNEDECKLLQLRVLDFNGFIAAAFKKLIRLDYLRKNNIRHVDELNQGAEGFVFNIQLYEHLTSCFYLQKPLLHYIYNGQSISHSFSERNNSLIIQCMEWIDSYAETSCNPFDLHAAVLERMLYVICTTAVTGYFSPYNNQSFVTKKHGFIKFMSEPLVAKSFELADKTKLNTQRKIILLLIKLKLWRIISLLGLLRKKQLENK